ncbi:hypothetical protein CC80DRAFT_431342, partial [Byssothecium circinans]
AGPKLASLTYQKLYGQEVRPEIDGDLVVRDEYLGWELEGQKPLNRLETYGVTFDHFVPDDDPDPEVLAISLVEVDDDGGALANKYLLFTVDSSNYTGKKVLAVPRCCQFKKGSLDRGSINDGVARRGREVQRRLKREE